MPDISNADIEGRLTALREVITAILRTLPTDRRMMIADALDTLKVVSDGQEDPGAVSSSAFAVEGSRAREVGVIQDGIRKMPEDGKP